MSDLHNILSTDAGKGGNKRLPEAKLMAYLEGKLTPQEQHEVEQWLADEGMESDALEGLQSLSPDETRRSVNKLNHDLRKTLVNKKKKRRSPQTNQFTYIAIIIILLLIVVAYIVMRKAM